MYQKYKKLEGLRKDKSVIKTALKRGGITFIGLVLFILAIIIFIFRPYSYGMGNGIPNGWGKLFVEKFKGERFNPKPISVESIPKHPFLANTNSSNMHVDGYASDVHPIGGVLGVNPYIQSYAHGKFAGQAATVAIDKNGNLLVVFGSFKKFSLVLMTPDLKPLAQMDLPPRKSNKSLNLRKIMNDISGGAYFFLDQNGSAVLVDAEQKLKVIKQDWSNEVPKLVIDYEYSLQTILNEVSVPEDVIVAVLPDWQGNYWFVSRLGLIGVINKESKEVSSLRLKGEEITNSFTVDSNGVYIVSDHALYGIRIDKVKGVPIIEWRETYERSSKRKLGSLSLGSGTTPTLLGKKFIAIADNSDLKTNVLVYKRGMSNIEKRLICKMPVFEAGKSTTENSLIGIGNSLIIENNYGYDLFTNMMFGKTGVGGMARVDFSEEDESCRIVWESPIVSQTTVPKLSLETGLIYAYTKSKPGFGIDAYYLTALDFETGKTAFEVLAGTGVGFDNNWSPITIGNDHCVYVGVLKGLIRVCDSIK